MLQRDPATGGLTAPGPCASADTAGPRAGCSDLPYNFFGVVDLEPTPDGALIAGGRFGRGFAAFSLAPDGTPTASAPPLGCIATGGIGFTTPCTIPRGFARAFGQDFGPNDVALSGDGKFVYGVSPQDAEDRAGIVAARRDTADPVCADGSVDVVAGQSVSIPLSCSDVDGDTLTVAIVAAPQLGTTGAVDQASQTVSYTAPTDFQGTQTLTFKGTEQGIDSALATVTINVVAPAQADTTPPELSLSGKKRQLLDGAVEVTASCNEACSATGAGTLTVTTKRKKGGKATLAKRKFTLRTTTAEIAGGGRSTLALKLPRKARKAATAALKHGGRVSARITVEAADPSGNKASAARSVKLKQRQALIRFAAELYGCRRSPIARVFAIAAPVALTTKQQIADRLDEARRMTLQLVEPLSEEQLNRVYSPLLSPLAWDLGHIANFEELWLVQEIGGLEPMRGDLGRFYDAIENPRAIRNELPILRGDECRAYLEEVRKRTLEVLDGVDLESENPLLRDGFVYELILAHEHQHNETMLQLLQMVEAYEPVERDSGPASEPVADGPEMVFVEGGSFEIGAGADGFAYDNERPQHSVKLDSFWIDRTPVSNAAFTAFIEETGSEPPMYWERDGGGGWVRTAMGLTEAVDPALPVIHVDFNQAEAFAHWAGKRLPTEFEWEAAAAGADRRTGQSRPARLRLRARRRLRRCRL